MNLKKILLITLIFLVLTGIFTYPFIFKLSTHIPAFETTDEPFGALWNFWYSAFSISNHLPGSSCAWIAAPFGMHNTASAYYVWDAINKILSLAVGNILTYNLQIIFSYLLSGLFMYLLLWHLTKNALASLVAGIIYAFCPFHAVRTWQHLGLAMIQWMPLYILTLLRLHEKQNIRRTIECGLCFFLVAAFDFYFAYFMLLITLVFVAYHLMRPAMIKTQGKFKFLRSILVSYTIALILLIPSISVILKGRAEAVTQKASAFNPFVRPFEDLFAQSARPLSYFLPASTHPLFGNMTQQMVGNSLYGESLTEHTLYLGIIPLILAFIAFKRRKDVAAKITASQNPGYYFTFFVVLAVASWLFSQPPWWDIVGLKIPMPSALLYKILPMFRAYCRFGIVVMLAVAVLAAYGFIAFSNKNKHTRTKIFLILMIGILFEFWTYPPQKVLQVSEFPAVYSWLAQQPNDIIIAEYPLDNGSPNEMYKFYQTKHHKKIINGTIPGSKPHEFAQTIAVLSAHNTPARLKGMGVTYVLVHHDGYAQSGLSSDLDELAALQAQKGLKLVKTFPGEDSLNDDIMSVKKIGQTDVYEIVMNAEPVAY